MSSVSKVDLGTLSAVGFSALRNTSTVSDLTSESFEGRQFRLHLPRVGYPVTVAPVTDIKSCLQYSNTRLIHLSTQGSSRSDDVAQLTIVNPGVHLSTE
jgi:hypothetical protein